MLANYGMEAGGARRLMAPASLRADRPLPARIPLFRLKLPLQQMRNQDAQASVKLPAFVADDRVQLLDQVLHVQLLEAFYLEEYGWFRCRTDMVLCLQIG